MPVFGVFANGSEIFKKINEILFQENFSEILTNGFPLKIQIPITMSIRANIFFEEY